MLKQASRFFTALLVAFACAVPTGAGAERPPNIIFIMVDDLGQEWISCYGSTSVQTPHIDRLADTGMRFAQSYSMPQCTPTRVTLLTGQYPFNSGWINHWDVPRWGKGCHFDTNEYPTFANVVKQAGYKTCAAGKWQISDFRAQPAAMKNAGFDEWCMWTGYETGNPPSGKRYADPYIFTSEGSKTYTGQFGPDVFTDFIIDFLGRHKDDPVLVYFPMVLTHTPFTATPLKPDAEGRDEKQVAMVEYTDHLVGRITRAVDDLELRDKTLIIFTTDNGSTGGLKGILNGRVVKGGKMTRGEPGVAAPFIVSAPGLVPEGVVTDALTDFTDMLPTFADLAGVSLPDDYTFDGVSIADVLLGGAEDSARNWIMAMGYAPAKFEEGRVRPKKDYMERIIRNKRYKVWVNDQGAAERLYDLKHDPGEEDNLLGTDDPASRAALEELMAVVRTWPEKDAHPRYTALPRQAWEEAF